MDKKFGERIFFLDVFGCVCDDIGCVYECELGVYGYEFGVSDCGDAFGVDVCGYGRTQTYLYFYFF